MRMRGEVRMKRLNEFIFAGDKTLRCGYTTGTCAAAATRAAAELLLAGEVPPAVVVSTPAGIDVVVDIEASECGAGWARCGVQKDAGDDPDVTDGVLVYATVCLSDVPGVTVEGGVGVGRITKPGLDQPMGAAAINSTPRAMIVRAAREVARERDFDGGLAIEISIPAGVELAARTFNPKLGIEGGISVLGTTGIVKPMSEEALVATLRLELRVLREEGACDVLVVPGNYGREFARDELGLDVERAVMCSNYVGAVVDEAARLGFSSLLLVGHVGKLVKVAAGIMNTHSRVADGRAEVMAAHAALRGASRKAVEAIMDAPTTDAMIEVLIGEGLLEDVMSSIMTRIHEVLSRRVGESLRVEVAMFSRVYGLLASSPDARL